MRIKRLVAKNFLSYSSIDIKFEDGLYLIYGENGKGKSSISEALYWGLYGKPLREVLVGDVVNNIVEKDCYVRVYLDNGYTVSRYRQHTKYKNELFLKKDKVDIRKSSTKETQKEIDNLIGVDATSFAIVAAFSVDTLRFISASDSDKKKLLDTLFPDMSYIKPKIKAGMDELKRKVDDLGIMYVELTSKISTLKEELQSLFKPVGAPSAKYFKSVVAKKKVIKDELQNIEAKGIQRKLDSQDDAYDAYQNMADLVEATKDSLEGCESDLSSLKANLCPTCNQLFKKDQAKGLIKRTKIDILAFTRELKKHNEKKLLLEKKLLSENVKDKYKKQLSRYDDLEQDLNDIYDKEKDLARLEGELEQYNKTTKRLKGSIKEVKFNKDEVKIELVKCKKKYRHYRYLHEALRDQGVTPIPVKSFLYELVLPILEEESQRYLSELDPLMSINISLEGREKIDVLVQKQDGGKKFGAVSGGEKRRADLAISLALRKLLSDRINILFLDDIFDPLDNFGLENVMGVLQNIERTSIFCMSPRKSEIPYFDNVYNVVKDENGFSKLVKE